VCVYVDVCVCEFVLGALECKGKQTQLPTHTQSRTHRTTYVHTCTYTHTHTHAHKINAMSKQN